MKLRISTRRLCALVAASALACSGIRGGPRPGYYGRLAGWEFGACRNDPAGVGSDSRGHWDQWQYQAGLWRSGPSLRPWWGAYARGGSVYGCPRPEAVALLW